MDDREEQRRIKAIVEHSKIGMSPAGNSYSSALLLLLVATLVSAGAADGTTWRWCGHVRPAIQRPTQYHLAAGTTVTQTGQTEVSLQPNGDLLCSCPTHPQAPPTELKVAVIAAQEGSNMTYTTTVVVPILNPCMAAVCQQTDPLQLSKSPLSVQAHSPPCGVKVNARVLDRSITLAVRTNASAVCGGCSSCDQYGWLIITQVFHPPHPNKPSLVTRQAFPLDLATCVANSNHPAPISLQRAPNSLMDHSPPPKLFQRVKRQANNQPEFDDLHYIVSVRENSPLGTIVTTVQANDPDAGSLGEITYTMDPVNSRSSSLFALHPSTGVVTTTGDIDREDMEEHVYHVTAKDGGGSMLTVTYTIEVEDENDNSPTFQDGSYYIVNIREDHTPGDPCEPCSITVIDEDAGSNGQVTYQLLNNTGGAFTIVVSGNQAMVKPVRELDFETLPCYLLTLLAIDEGGSPHTSSATIEVRLIDVADNPPVFNASSYSIAIRENATLGTDLLTVHATSVDSSSLGVVQYFIVGGDPNTRFHLNPSTGELTLLQSLDYETTERYALSVQARSGQGPGGSLKTLVSATVEVLNVNDHQPTFGRTQYTVSVLEGMAVGHYVLGVSAEDSDAGNFGVVTYRIDSNASDSDIEMTFDLDSALGSITTLVVLDHDGGNAEYGMVVVAEDGGMPPRTTEVRVVVRVSDINDEVPTFSQEFYSASITEDAGITSTVANVTAEDSDSAIVEYLIGSGNIENKFSLERTSGVIKVSGALDRELTPFYTLMVVATDGQLETSVLVHITVTDVNDKLPIFSHTYYDSSGVSESLQVSDVILQVLAMDADIGVNGLVTYSSDDIPPEFSLNASTGLITLASSLDYDEENGKYYSFAVRASDGGTPSLSSTATVDITVKDENDNAPMFLPDISVEGFVLENAREHTSVLQLAAYDKDVGSNAAFSFSITGDYTSTQVFAVDQSGMVYTTKALDREVQEVYSVRVQVTDNGQDPLSSSITVTITVEDEIDYPPVFSQVSYEVRVTAQTNKDSLLVTVNAITRDDILSSSILYTISSGANQSLFSMDQSSGEIRAANALDPKLHAGIYNMLVTAQHYHLSETVPVIVTIKVKDGIPRLRPLTVYFNVLHSQLKAGLTELSSVQVLEDGEGVQPYSFSIHSSTDQRVLRYFSIGQDRGNISVDGSVMTGYYSLNVSVSSPTGAGYGEVEVFVRVLTNATLDHAVVAVFGNAGEIDFAAVQLERFTQFVMDIIPCSREQVEVFAIQQPNPLMTVVEVAFAVRQIDLQGYLDLETIIDRLQANQQQARPPSLLEFGSFVCMAEPCPNYQRCSSLLHLLRYSSQTPNKRLQSTETVYLSHPFSQSYRCSCPPGYSPEGTCGVEVNECRDNPCHFDAHCIDLVNDYVCECPKDTLGKNCGVVCPSPSCLPCSPSPCLHGGECSISSGDASASTCESCPWGDQYSGPHCQLTSLYFSPGSYAAFAPLGSPQRTNLSFSYSTVRPTGLLLYNGHTSGLHDFIAVELVIGQIKVSMSFGDEAIISLKTESLWLLNDGRWHTVVIQLNGLEVSVSVSECSNSSEALFGSTEYCQLSGQVPSLQRSSLDVYGPLYVGGVETHVPALSLSGTTYHGCIANLTIDHTLLDLSVPVRTHGTRKGCPPRDVSCEDVICVSGECVEVWNGTVCSCEGVSPSCTVVSDSAQLSAGYFQLEQGSESQTALEEFFMEFRTWDSNAVLAQFGDAASLELSHGSLVYRRAQGDQGSGLTAVTLTVDAFVSDSLWHSVKLTTDDVHILSVDGGRTEASQPVGGKVRVNTITIGAPGTDSNSGQFSGCIGMVIINNNRLALASASEPGIHNVDPYTITSSNTTAGCGGGGGCQGVQCPENSECTEGWLSYTCQCKANFKLVGENCVEPCHPNPCQNGGACSPHPSSSVGFQCGCERPYTGQMCEVVEGDACPLGMYPDPECRLCLCDPEGVEEEVCEGDTGDCLCQVDLPVFNPPGDIGCQTCICDPLGSTSPNCDPTTGQCSCKTNVTGTFCDRCRDGTAGIDELGCRESTDLFGSFVLIGVTYTSDLGEMESTEMAQLAGHIEGEVARELAQFGLPGIQEATLTSVSNSSMLSRVHYRVSAYLQRDSGLVPRPSIHTLASVLQSVVQSGWVGSYQTEPFSHFVNVRCACEKDNDCYLTGTNEFQPFGCNKCSLTGEDPDGVICRANVPEDCSGTDTDRDGVPDSCDNCLHTFNPSQRAGDCATIEGVCGGEGKDGVLWSPTATGTHDTKPCRSPYKGYTVRECLEGGVWTEASEVGCVSPEGQQWELLAQSLEDGQLLRQQEAIFIARELVEFVKGGEGASGGDLQAGGRLMAGLVRLQGVGGTQNDSGMMRTLTEVGSNLLDPRHAPQWSGVASQGNFFIEDLLSTLEELALLTFDLLGQALLSEDYVSVETVPIVPEQFNGQVFNASSVDGVLSTVEVPAGLISNGSSAVGLAVSHLPTIGPLLPRRLAFEPEHNLTAGGPVLSVQVRGLLPPSPLSTPITITFGYTGQVLRLQDVYKAVCVYWEYGDRGGWSREGCWVLVSNSTHTICQCSHITSFTVLLPTTAFMEVPTTTPTPYRYVPAEFTYVVFSFISLLLLLALCVLTCLSSIQSLQNTVHKHLVASIVASGIIFIAFIDRTEVEAVCSVFAVVLLFFLLSTLSWLLSECVVISRLMLQSQLSSKETCSVRVYLYVIGWAIPLLLCGIATGVVGIVNQSFSEQFGYPHYCWLGSELVWAFVVPATLLIAVDIVALVVALWLTTRPPPPTHSQRTTPLAATLTKHKARMSLSISALLLAFYIMTWLFGLLAIYGNEFSDSASQTLESIFAILYATMGVFVFIVMTLNSKVREACKAQFQHKDGNDDSLESTIAASSLQTQLHFTSRPYSAPQHQPRTGFHNTLNTMDLLEIPPVPMMTHPLNESKLHTLPPTSPSKSLQRSRNDSLPEEPQLPWFSIPEATPLSPLTYGSEADVSSEGTDVEHRGNGSTSISELYHETRQSSPEDYLEYNQEQVPPQQSPVSPQTTEDPLWYRPRDSVGPSDQLEVVQEPMPYETVVRPPPSPQRSVKWKDLKQTDFEPPSKASPHLSERSCSSTKTGDSSSSSHTSPRGSSHSSPRAAPKLSSPEQPRVSVGRTMSDSAPLLPPHPHPLRGTRSLQRPPAVPTYPCRPVMSRTASNNLPQPHVPHPQVHRRASEHSRGQGMEGSFPPPTFSQVSRVSSASRASSGPQKQLPGRPTVMHKSNLESHSSSQRGTIEEQDTALGDTYHSNGPSVEGNINQVIRHADGSETVQSLV